MADTIRDRADILALFADNTSGDISEQDLRDYVVSSWGVYGQLSIIDNSSYTQSSLATSPSWTTLLHCDTSTANGVTPVATQSTTNTLTCATGGAGVYFIWFVACFTGSSNATYLIKLFNNAVATGFQCERKIGTGTDVGNTDFHGIITLAEADVLDVRAQADAASKSITVQSGQFGIMRIK